MMTVRACVSMGRFGALLLFATLALAPAHAIDVETVHDPEASFAAYRTFAWRGAPPDPATDPEGHRRLVHRVVTETVEAELGAKGLRLSEEQPDLWVVYVAFAQAASHGAVYHGSGAWRGMELRRTELYTEGSLILELVDRVTGRTVWHGVARVGVDPKRLEKKARNAVRKLLKRFPPTD